MNKPNYRTDYGATDSSNGTQTTRANYVLAPEKPARDEGSSNGTQTTRANYVLADEPSIAWLMRRLHLPSEIEVKGVTVSLEWDKSADIRQDDDEIGEAVHTVDEAELAAGIAPGPNDGEVIEIEGMKFRLGSHDYETSDGQVTCSAKIYRAL